ncbi:MAG TPA: hypothetical protein VMX79_12540 [bacterium]|jgi:hypothetical protein|nr:hypothetical protein [bacterium]
MNKKIAAVILIVMLAVLAALVVANTVAERSLGTVKATFTETR